MVANRRNGTSVDADIVVAAQLEEAEERVGVHRSTVRAEAETRITGAREEVARMLDEARVELRGQAQELAREAASRVLGRPLT